MVTGFEADFQSWRQALKAESVYHFFHEIIPVFEKLGNVDLSDKLEELYNLASPQVQIASKGGLLEIQFDFQDIAQEEIDQAMQALVANKIFTLVRLIKSTFSMKKPRRFAKIYRNWGNLN